jgi:hypothetical protein
MQGGLNYYQYFLSNGYWESEAAKWKNKKIAHPQGHAIS